MPLELTAAERGIVGRHLVETSSSVTAAKEAVLDFELLLGRPVPFEELPEQVKEAAYHLRDAALLLNDYSYSLLT